jgi:PAS domain S-box-containing protein
MQVKKNITQYITLFAGILILLIIFLFPLGYFLISYQYMIGELDAEAYINARLITQIINANPQMWEFQQLRIQEYLLPRPKTQTPEIRRVLNMKNEMIVQSMDKLRAPLIMHADELLDSGKAVGRIEIYRSLRPLLMQTGLVALFMMPVGLGIFIMLRNLPIKTIHKMERTLQRSEERFRELFDNAPVGYHEFDIKGRITHVNRTELEMLGYTLEERVGQFVWSSITEEEESRNTVLGKLADVIPPSRSLERIYRRKDGTTFPALVQDLLIRDEKGRITGIRSTIQDITERKQAEEEREKLILDLQEAIAKVKVLSGMLPICASCKKIRDDKGYWKQIEVYIRDHSEVEFSHGICPDCMKKLYPDFEEDG